MCFIDTMYRKPIIGGLTFGSCIVNVSEQIAIICVLNTMQLVALMDQAFSDLFMKEFQSETTSNDSEYV